MESTVETHLKNPPADHPTATATACFDCSICLDFAVEPVVTLCGHLYCWPCIYKWLHQQQQTPFTPQHCPVCKSSLSQSALVPLYGRGHKAAPAITATATATTDVTIPRRPSHAVVESPPRRRRRGGEEGVYLRGAVGSPAVHSVFGGAAVAVLPWVFGNVGSGLYYTNPYHVLGGEEREQRAEARSLQRISVFLFCCVVLCLLLF